MLRQSNYRLKSDMHPTCLQTRTDMPTPEGQPGPIHKTILLVVSVFWFYYMQGHLYKLIIIKAQVKTTGQIFILLPHKNGAKNCFHKGCPTLIRGLCGSIQGHYTSQAGKSCLTPLTVVKTPIRSGSAALTSIQEELEYLNSLSCKRLHLGL